MCNSNYQDNSSNKQQRCFIYRGLSWVTKRQQGAIFGATFIILALLGSLMLLQNVAWHAQIQTRQQLTIMAQLDALQFRASLIFAETQQTTFRLADADITVQGDDLRIRWGQTTYTRALLRRVP